MQYAAALHVVAAVYCTMQLYGAGPGGTLALIGLVFVYKLRVMLYIPPSDHMKVSEDHRLHPCLLHAESNTHEKYLGFMIQNKHYSGVQLPNQLKCDERKKNKVMGSSGRSAWTVQTLMTGGEKDVALNRRVVLRNTCF